MTCFIHFIEHKIVTCSITIFTCSRVRERMKLMNKSLEYVFMTTLRIQIGFIIWRDLWKELLTKLFARYPGRNMNHK
jgi:hypothetical protein